MAARRSSGASPAPPSPTSSEQALPTAATMHSGHLCQTSCFPDHMQTRAVCRFLLSSKPSLVALTQPLLLLPPLCCRGVTKLVLGWGTSPVLAMACATILYFLVRTFVMRAHNAYVRALYVMPMAVWLTIFVICYTVIQVGSRCKLPVLQARLLGAQHADRHALLAGVPTLCCNLPCWRPPFPPCRPVTTTSGGLRSATASPAGSLCLWPPASPPLLSSL